MCIVFFEWTEDRFLVCHNRDEFFSRPTTNTEWWPNGGGDDNDDDNGNGDTNTDSFEILAPRDVVSGGTWFGFEKTTGRCAFLTNMRELDSTKYSSSRGEFVVNYLKSDTTLSALEYLQQEFGDSEGGAASKDYAGFNLVVFSGHDLAYVSNRYPDDHPQKGPIALSIGTPYGLSNSVLEEPYFKVRNGLEIFDRVLTEKSSGNSVTSNEDDDLMKGLERLMQRNEYYPGDPLPRTGEPGFSEAKVKHRGCICVPNVDGYGTRTTIRFLLECLREQGEGDDGSEQPRTREKQRLLRCVEKNWNLATLEWEESMGLNCTISLR